MMTTPKPNIIFILGQPGSGKGTQSYAIVQNYNFAHLSAGDLLREELKLPLSPHRDVIKKNVDAGTIVPVEITCALIKKRMDEISSAGTSNFIIDGFPRNWDNVHGWERTMSQFVNLICVLVLDVTEDVCIDRCLNRSDNSGRTDDNLDCLKKRLGTYANDTVHIINYYLKQGIVRKVNASKAPDEVYEDIKALLAAISIFPKPNAISP